MISWSLKVSSRVACYTQKCQGNYNYKILQCSHRVWVSRVPLFECLPCACKGMWFLVYSDPVSTQLVPHPGGLSPFQPLWDGDQSLLCTWSNLSFAPCLSCPFLPSLFPSLLSSFTFPEGGRSCFLQTDWLYRHHPKSFTMNYKGKGGLKRGT